jgi:hypothetical protein
MRTLIERIDEALAEAGGRMTFSALAEKLYPDPKSHRHQINGGPPGCYMALSAALRRGGYVQDWRDVGPGNRVVYARKSEVMSLRGTTV